MARMTCIHAQVAAIREKADTLRLSKYTRRVLDYLLTEAERTGRLSISPTNARIATAVGCCRRTVQYAFETLRDHGIGIRTPGSGCERPSRRRRLHTLPPLDCTPGMWVFTASEAAVSSFCDFCTLSNEKGSSTPKICIFAPVEPYAPEAYPGVPPDDWIFDPNAYLEADARSAAPRSARPRSPRRYTPVRDMSDEDAMAWAEAVSSGAIPPPVDIYPERVGEYGYGERWTQFERAVAEFEATHGHPYDDLFDGPLLPSDTAARVGHKPVARRRRTDDTSQVALEEKQAFAKTHTTASHRFRLLRGRVDEVVYESVNTS